MEEQNKEVVQEITKEDLLKKMNDLLEMNEVTELINNNEKIFDFEGVTYRLRKPNFNQKQEVYKKRIEKYVEMLKDDRYLLEKDLRELYKKKGIDIDSMEKNINAKIKKRDDFMFKLGEAIKKNSNDETLQTLKKEIEELNSEIQILSVEKSSYLEISLEQQLIIFIYTYFIFLLAEKKDGENWIRVWNNYDDFMNGKQELINKFSYYVTIMVSSETL